MRFFENIIAEYYIAITFGFVSELLAKNSWVEVLEPASLREQFIAKIEEMKDRYKEKQ